MTNSWKCEDRGLPSDKLRVERIDLTPEVPKPGEPATVVITGTAAEEIKDGAYLDVHLKLGLITIMKNQFYLYELIKNRTLTVDGLKPGETIKASPVVMTYRMDFPSQAPQAKFKMIVAGYTAEDDDLLSLDLTCDLTP